MLKMQKKIGFLLLIFSLNISCGVYSFSGASVPLDVKSMSIEYITNKAPNSWSSLDRIFNNELKQKMISDAGLKILDKEGDYQIKGYISSYTITPQAATNGEFANTYKLSISVQIEFTDIKTEKKLAWNENFTNFEVYSNDITNEEDRLITSISKNISNQIFNKIFSTW
jgi:hypothetical protein